MRPQRVRRQVNNEPNLSSYGNTLTYECGLARRFEDPDSKLLYDTRSIMCNWNKTWSPHTELDSCVWVACINPPTAPSPNLISNWDGIPVNFTHNVSYTCDIGHYFESNMVLPEFNLTCKGKDANKLYKSKKMLL